VAVVWGDGVDGECVFGFRVAVVGRSFWEWKGGNSQIRNMTVIP
jgi:hypothetical protein